MSRRSRLRPADLSRESPEFARASGERVPAPPGAEEAVGRRRVVCTCGWKGTIAKLREGECPRSRPNSKVHELSYDAGAA